MTSDYVANREFKMKGKTYKSGEVVDLKGLPPQKISQLLDQRWLRPIPQKTTG